MKHFNLNVLEDALIVGGITISVTMIQSILGIIILSCQIIIILIKAGKKIYDLIKKKKYDEIDDALEETKDQLEDLKDKQDGKH